jgi:hypothetical protein
VSKTANDADIVAQTLEESYKELLALRLLVRRIERENASDTDVAAKTRGTLSRRK